MTNPRHILRSQQFDRVFLEDLFRRTHEIERKLADQKRRHNLRRTHEGAHMAVIFYQPSTRTRLSFLTAAQRLGIQCVDTEHAREFSSAAKGETLEDTMHVLCGYRYDVIVLRHLETGSAQRAAAVCQQYGIPLINAGDGTGQHPTQALLDLYTIQQEKSRLDKLHLIIGGDLANGRTVRSLAYLLGKFNEITISFVSPSHLAPQDDIKAYLSRHDVAWQEYHSLDALPEAIRATTDVIYWTRTQTEYGSTKEGEMQITPEVLDTMNPDLILLHPLPRVHEIAPEVDSMPQARYFAQAGNGMLVRMALLDYVLELR